MKVLLALGFLAALLTPAIHGRPLPKTPVNLNSGSIDSTLPFDEPFLLEGAVGKATVRVQVLVKELAADAKTEIAMVDSADWVNRNGTESPTFQLRIKPLKSRQRYSFHFSVHRNLTPAESTAFKSEAEAILREELGRIDWKHLEAFDANFFPGLLGRVHKRLSLALEFKFIPKPGTLLDLSEENSGRATAALRPLTDNAVNRPIICQNLNELILIALGETDSLRKVGGLESVLHRLETYGKEHPDPATQQGWSGLIEAAKAGRDFAKLPPYETELVLAGRRIFGVAGTPIGEDSLENDTLGQLRSRETNLQVTLGKIAGLAAFYDSTLQMPEFRPLFRSDSLPQRMGMAFRKLGSVLRSEIEVLGSLIASDEAAKINLANLKSSLRASAADQSILAATTTANFKTSATWYISNDFGLLYGYPSHEILPYLGVNFYFRPVNKNAPLSTLPEEGGYRCGRRFAVMVGMTLNSIAEPNRRKGILGDKGLLLGAGARMTDYVRFSAGTVLFNALDPNPLITKIRIKGVGFVALSLDVDTKNLLMKVGEALGGGG